VEFADFRGDSFKLSQLAARRRRRASSCSAGGLHAESADVLAQPHQQVVLPDLRRLLDGGMATLDDVEDAWDQLVGTHGTRSRRSRT